MVQTCWNINVYVVNTDIYIYIILLKYIMLKPTWMFMDSMRKQTYQSAQYKLKIVIKIVCYYKNCYRNNKQFSTRQITIKTSESTFF